MTSPLETKKELTESLVFFSVAPLAREIGCFFEKWHFLEILGGLNVHPHTIYGAPINTLEA